MLQRVIRYIREVRTEARRVVWLNRRQTLTYTAVVVVAVGVLAGLMYGFDEVITLASRAFVGLV